MEERPHALLSDEELSAALSMALARIAGDFADYYALISEVDRRPGFVPGARPGAEAKTLLRMLRVADPAEDVRLARVLADLPHLRKALATGEASRTHVKIAEHALRTIRSTNPAALDDPADLAVVDATLTDAARDLAPREFRTCTQRLQAHLADNSADTLNRREVERRELVIWEEGDGWIGLSGRLDPVTGAHLRAAVDHFAKPAPSSGPDGSATEGLLRVRDPRSKRQRQADAIGLAARLALNTNADPHRPHVVIHTRPDTTAAEGDQTGPLRRAWFARFLCDATIEQLTRKRGGEALQLGRKARTATPTQRRVLIARDQTCVIPNCTVPARWSDAHHIQWWSRGGATNVSNMAMICGPHHTEVHAGTWSLEMRDGVPWARPPRHIDPHQEWRRNTYQYHQEMSQQMALTLNPPPRRE
jgi:hypothetical protein